jgi:hypothetical protein
MVKTNSTRNEKETLRKQETGGQGRSRPTKRSHEAMRRQQTALVRDLKVQNQITHSEAST